jgi:hypothetical protein
MTAIKQPARYWMVRQRGRNGPATARVCAPDYAAALERAAQIGFRNPWAVVLDESRADEKRPSLPELTEWLLQADPAWEVTQLEGERGGDLSAPDLQEMLTITLSRPAKRDV